MKKSDEYTFENIMKLQAETLETWYEDYDKMQQTQLWEDGAPGFDETYGQRQPSIAVIPGSKNEQNGAVIICAGGGFVFKSFFEGRSVAEKFASMGFCAAVLDYRVNPYTQYDMMEDAKRAVRLLRSNAGEWNINPEKITILGFSAGGQIAALTGTKFDNGNPEALDPIDRNSCRPDAVISCYSSLSFCSSPEPNTDLENLGGVYTREDRINLSAEKNINLETPPFFIWGTVEDEALDQRYMLQFASALSDMEVPFELHLFEKGPHGMGLCDETCPLIPKPNAHAGRWVELCVEWLKEKGF